MLDLLIIQLSQDELKKIEDINRRDGQPDRSYETLTGGPFHGAAALFGEKYGERVRVVKMGDFSLELCGGTHLRSTSEVGLFKLTGESSVGAGLRRVEAVTGEGALGYIEAREEQLAGVARLVKAAPHEILHRVESLLKTIKDLEAESEALQARLARYQVNDLLDSVKTVRGVKVLAGRTVVPDMDSLRGMVDLLRDKIGSGLSGLAAAIQAKKSLVVVTRDLLKRGLRVGKLVKEVAAVIGVAVEPT